MSKIKFLKDNTPLSMLNLFSNRKLTKINGQTPRELCLCKEFRKTLAHFLCCEIGIIIPKYIAKKTLHKKMR